MKRTRYYFHHIDVTNCILRDENPFGFNPRYDEIRVVEVWVNVYQ